MAAGDTISPRCLPQCVDIVLEILRFFDHREWDGERDGAEVDRTSTLSCFARTCKAFFALAIPILWRRLRSLRPILGLIGSLAHTEGQAECTMARFGIYPYRWRRLCVYATYVIELDVLEPECRLELSVWRMLPHLTHGKPLLPNLSDLRWRITSSQCTALVHFVSPSLTKLVIHSSIPKGDLSLAEQLEWGFALWMPLSLTLRVAPRLTHVSLSYLEVLSPIVLSPISRSRSLQSFQLCVNAKGGPLIHTYDPLLILNAERLQYLDVNFEPALSSYRCKHSIDEFHSLRSLAISHGPGSDAWYSSFAFPVLTRLTIHRYRDDTLMDFRATCATWARHFPALQSLSCELAPNLTVPLRLADATAPLLSIRDMREFSLTFTLNTQLTVLDADLVDVAQSWPRLTSFALIASSTGASCEPGWGAEGPGFRALEAFKQRCPALERLWLPHLVLRARDARVPAGKRAPREGEPGHGMREVVARWIDADNYWLAAARVDRLFPNLKNRAALWRDSLGEDEDGGDGEESDVEEMCTVCLVFGRTT